MSIQNSIDLFNSNINKTYWTRQDRTPSGGIAKTVARPVVLPIENYYKVLLKKFVKVGENSGSVPSLDTSNFAEYYANETTGEAIAVVKSVKVVASIPTKIAIATYYDQAGEIAIINRFDQTGHPHENHFNVYGSSLSLEELEFYKRYLSDHEYTDPTGVAHYQATVPHIHFNTKSQTLAFRHHDKANAISINKLMIYLNDLKNDLNPSSLINNIDMGMPFLDLKEARVEYTSTMLSSVTDIINFFDAMKRVSPDKFSDYEKETIDLMKSLINLGSGDSPEGGLSAVGPSGDASISPTGGYPTSSSGGSGGSTGGGTGSGVISNSISFMSLNGSELRLTETDLVHITNYLPDINGLNVAELTEIKKRISKAIRDLEKAKKYGFDRNREEQPYLNGNVREQIHRYKEYLKYVKGLLNLEKISIDLNKYMEIYKIINERDPMLMSVISNELLKNLTVNIKPQSDKNKGDFCYGNNRQPE